MESSMEVLQKTETRSIIQSSDTTPGIYPKECKSIYNRDSYTSMFIVALFTTVKLWKQPRCLTTDEWIKKMSYIYT
jgi:hypothetical protein